MWVTNFIYLDFWVICMWGPTCLLPPFFINFQNFIVLSLLTNSSRQELLGDPFGITWQLFFTSLLFSIVIQRWFWKLRKSSAVKYIQVIFPSPTTLVLFCSIPSLMHRVAIYFNIRLDAPPTIPQQRRKYHIKWVITKSFILSAACSVTLSSYLFCVLSCTA